jgi:hypothetical protein
VAMNFCEGPRIILKYFWIKYEENNNFRSIFLLQLQRVSYYQGMGLLQVLRRGIGLQIWWAGMNILSTKMWKADKEWFSLYEVGNKSKSSST